MRTLPAAAATALAAAIVPAQFQIVVPAGTATTEANSSNAFPWGRGGGGIRIQNLYDSTNFTSQGVGYPILIDRLRWRVQSANLQTWVATSYQQATVSLSTCPLDFATPSLVFVSRPRAWSPTSPRCRPRDRRRSSCTSRAVRSRRLPAASRRTRGTSTAT